jgi:hypothetical protein
MPAQSLKVAPKQKELISSVLAINRDDCFTGRCIATLRALQTGIVGPDAHTQDMSTARIPSSHASSADSINVILLSVAVEHGCIEHILKMVSELVLNGPPSDAPQVDALCAAIDALIALVIDTRHGGTNDHDVRNESAKCRAVEAKVSV